MSAELEKTFWTRLDDVIAGMLEADSTRAVPMAPKPDAEARVIWFITARGSAADAAAKAHGSARFHVADPKAQLFAEIHGTLSRAEDDEKLDEIWGSYAGAWFDDGKEDDEVQLLKFTPSLAEVWTTDGAVKTLFEMARASTTGTTPDIGAHGRLEFA